MEKHKQTTFVHSAASIDQAKEVIPPCKIIIHTFLSHRLKLDEFEVYNQPNLFIENAEQFVIEMEEQLNKLEFTKTSVHDP